MSQTQDTNPDRARTNRRFRPDIYHLYLQQLLMVGGVHLLQGLLELMVPVQEGFPQLCRQVEICKHRPAASTQGAGQTPMPQDWKRLWMCLGEGDNTHRQDKHCFLLLIHSPDEAHENLRNALGSPCDPSSH